MDDPTTAIAARSTRVAASVAALVLACGDRDPPRSPAPTNEASAALDVPDPTPEPAPVDPWVASELDALRLPARLQWPVENVHITATFAVTSEGMPMHQGLDFRGQAGDLVLSIGDGTVTACRRDPLLGNVVIVDHGQRVTSLYAHLSDILVHEGVPVERGAAIGLVGTTGNADAPHLHLGIEVADDPVDPLLLLGQPLHAPDALVKAAPEAPARPRAADTATSP